MNSALSVELYAGDGSEWDSFVGSQSASTNYHLFGWKTVVERSFGHKSYCLAARRSRALVGVLPLIHMKSRLFGNFLISVPFFNYGGLVWSDPDAVPCLLAEAERLLSEFGASHLELRHLGMALEGMPTKSHKMRSFAGTCETWAPPCMERLFSVTC
jgi:hypothetical protein